MDIKELTLQCDELMEKVLTPLVNQIIDENKLPSSARTEIYALLTGSSAHEVLKQGFEVIFQDLSHTLSPDSWEKLSEEWLNAIVKALNLNTLLEANEKASNDPNDYSKQKLLGISDETLENFYNVALKNFNNKDFIKAKAAFSVVLWLSPLRFNPWMGLGLATQALEETGIALNAFAFATLTDPCSVLPHLHSAECYLKKNEKSDAIDTLTLAFDTLKKYPCDDQQIIEEHLRRLKQQCSK